MPCRKALRSIRGLALSKRKDCVVDTASSFSTGEWRIASSGVRGDRDPRFSEETMAHRNLTRILRCGAVTLLAAIHGGCSDGTTSGTDKDPDPTQSGSGDTWGSATGGAAPASGGALISPDASGGGGAGSGGMSGLPSCPSTVDSAFEGKPSSLPGRIEAENYDPLGYYDDSVGNEDGGYRPDEDVDIKPLDGGYAISWFTSGEWLEYSVNVMQEGDYEVTAHSASTESNRVLALSSCGDPLGTIAVPTVADWGDMGWSAPTVVHLQEGLQKIRVTVGAEDFVDLDALEFRLTDGPIGSGGADTGGSGGGGTDAPHHKFVGNITTFNSADTDGLVFSDYWDQITPENAGKWQSVQGSITSPRNWSTLTALYDYAQSKGILFKQHVFVWGSQQPSGNITEADVKSWMTEFCQRFPNTPLIDVVNEPPPHTEPSYAGAIGGGTNGDWAWISNAFVWAEEACPDSILILNDYNNIEYADQNQHFIDIAKAVKASGAPIHAVGAQSHALHGQFGASTETMIQLLSKLHDDVGLPVYITEYDIGEANDQIQLDKYQQHMTYFLETEWIHGITVWGWINGKTWIDNSGIMNGKNPRPAMTWLMETLDRPVP